jgi:biopolymer transport protein ExbD
MKFKRPPAEKIETQMAPMIDVVFQLLIFFMLTLKIIEPEGDFNINMPLGAPSEQTKDINLADIKVRLEANPQSGQLTKLKFGQTVLGENAAGMSEPEVAGAFANLNKQIELVSNRLGPNKKDQEVEIDADFGLHYQYGIRAVSACTGKMQDGTLTRFIEKIKFTAPKEDP